MKRGVLTCAILALLAFALAGCGDFQQRAVEIQSTIQDAQEKAQTAEDAAVQNTGRLLELENRVDKLEAALASLQEELRETATEDGETP